MSSITSVPSDPRGRIPGGLVRSIALASAVPPCSG